MGFGSPSRTDEANQVVGPPIFAVRFGDCSTLDFAGTELIFQDHFTNMQFPGGSSRLKKPLLRQGRGCRHLVVQRRDIWHLSCP